MFKLILAGYCCLFVVAPVVSFSQLGPESEFSLVFFSNTIKYDARKLDREIKKAATLDSVKKLSAATATRRPARA